MATDVETLDILEKKIEDLEIQVYGEKYEDNDGQISIIESLLQANTMISAALSGREKFTNLFKRLHELNDYMELNPLSEDLTDLNTKLNIICSMQDELASSVEKMEEINKLKTVLDKDKVTNVQLLRNDLTNLLSQHLSAKEKLNALNTEVSNVLFMFNEICLEISKSFFLVNEAITKIENQKK